MATTSPKQFLVEDVIVKLNFVESGRTLNISKIFEDLNYIVDNKLDVIHDERVQTRCLAILSICDTDTAGVTPKPNNTAIKIIAARFLDFHLKGQGTWPIELVSCMLDDYFAQEVWVKSNQLSQFTNRLILCAVNPSSMSLVQRVHHPFKTMHAECKSIIIGHFERNMTLPNIASLKPASPVQWMRVASVFIEAMPELRPVCISMISGWISSPIYTGNCIQLLNKLVTTISPEYTENPSSVAVDGLNDVDVLNHVTRLDLSIMEGKIQLFISNVLQEICKKSPKWSFALINEYFVKIPLERMMSKKMDEYAVSLPHNWTPILLEIETYFINVNSNSISSFGNEAGRGMYSLYQGLSSSTTSSQVIACAIASGVRQIIESTVSNDRSSLKLVTTSQLLSLLRVLIVKLISMLQNIVDIQIDLFVNVLVRELRMDDELMDWVVSVVVKLLLLKTDRLLPALTSTAGQAGISEQSGGSDKLSVAQRMRAGGRTRGLERPSNPKQQQQPLSSMSRSTAMVVIDGSRNTLSSISRMKMDLLIDIANCQNFVIESTLTSMNLSDMNLQNDDNLLLNCKDHCLWLLKRVIGPLLFCSSSLTDFMILHRPSINFLSGDYGICSSRVIKSICMTFQLLNPCVDQDVTGRVFGLIDLHVSRMARTVLSYSSEPEAVVELIDVSGMKTFDWKCLLSLCSPKFPSNWLALETDRIVICGRNIPGLFKILTVLHVSGICPMASRLSFPRALSMLAIRLECNSDIVDSVAHWLSRKVTLGPSIKAETSIKVGLEQAILMTHACPIAAFKDNSSGVVEEKTNNIATREQTEDELLDESIWGSPQKQAGDDGVIDLSKSNDKVEIDKFAGKKRKRSTELSNLVDKESNCDVLCWVWLQFSKIRALKSVEESYQFINSQVDLVTILLNDRTETSDNNLSSFLEVALNCCNGCQPILSEFASKISPAMIQEIMTSLLDSTLASWKGIQYNAAVVNIHLIQLPIGDGLIGELPLDSLTCLLLSPSTSSEINERVVSAFSRRCQRLVSQPEESSRCIDLLVKLFFHPSSSVRDKSHTVINMLFNPAVSFAKMSWVTSICNELQSTRGFSTFVKLFVDYVKEIGVHSFSRVLLMESNQGRLGAMTNLVFSLFDYCTIDVNRLCPIFYFLMLFRTNSTRSMLANRRVGDILQQSFQNTSVSDIWSDFFASIPSHCEAHCKWMVVKSMCMQLFLHSSSTEPQWQVMKSIFGDNLVKRWIVFADHLEEIDSNSSHFVISIGMMKIAMSDFLIKFPTMYSDIKLSSVANNFVNSIRQRAVESNSAILSEILQLNLQTSSSVMQVYDPAEGIMLIELVRHQSGLVKSDMDCTRVDDLLLSLKHDVLSNGRYDISMKIDEIFQISSMESSSFKFDCGNVNSFFAILLRLNVLKGAVPATFLSLSRLGDVYMIWALVVFKCQQLKMLVSSSQVLRLALFQELLDDIDSLSNVLLGKCNDEYDFKNYAVCEEIIGRTLSTIFTEQSNLQLVLDAFERRIVNLYCSDLAAGVYSSMPLLNEEEASIKQVIAFASTVIGFCCEYKPLTASPVLKSLFSGLSASSGSEFWIVWRILWNFHHPESLLNIGSIHECNWFNSAQSLLTSHEDSLIFQIVDRQHVIVSDFTESSLVLNSRLYYSYLEAFAIFSSLADLLVINTDQSRSGSDNVTHIVNSKYSLLLPSNCIENQAQVIASKMKQSNAFIDANPILLMTVFRLELIFFLVLDSSPKSMINIYMDMIQISTVDIANRFAVRLEEEFKECAVRIGFKSDLDHIVAVLNFRRFFTCLSYNVVQSFNSIIWNDGNSLIYALNSLSLSLKSSSRSFHNNGQNDDNGLPSPDCGFCLIFVNFVCVRIINSCRAILTIKLDSKSVLSALECLSILGNKEGQPLLQSSLRNSLESLIKS